MSAVIKIGTRSSTLALIQTNLVADALMQAAPGSTVEVIHISTLGDRKQGTAAASRSDKRDWVQDLETAVLDGRVDIAVHSGKDVPEDCSPDVVLCSVLKRADPSDIFIGKKDPESGRRIAFKELRAGSSVGTASLRRQAQLLRAISGVKVIEHRGNVNTRIEKLDTSETLSGIILARAGVERMKITNLDYESLPDSVMVPAVNQGILTVQCARKNQPMLECISKIQDRFTISEFEAERGCVSILKADCDSAVCIFAQAKNDRVQLRAQVMTPDGAQMIEASGEAQFSDARRLGVRIARELESLGAQAILEKSRHWKAKIENRL